MASVRARPGCAVHMAARSEQPAEPRDDGGRVRDRHARRRRSDRGPSGLVRDAAHASVVGEPAATSCSGAPTARRTLLGQNGDGFIAAARSRPSAAAPRDCHATGTLSPRALAEHVEACDLLVQPYPDGISSRRTSAMAGLALGVPVVTTTGHLTESLWAETRRRLARDVGRSRALRR